MIRFKAPEQLLNGHYNETVLSNLLNCFLLNMILMTVCNSWPVRNSNFLLLFNAEACTKMKIC